MAGRTWEESRTARIGPEGVGTMGRHGVERAADSPRHPGGSFRPTIARCRRVDHGRQPSARPGCPWAGDVPCRRIGNRGSKGPESSRQESLQMPTPLAVIRGRRNRIREIFQVLPKSVDLPEALPAFSGDSTERRGNEQECCSDPLPRLREDETISLILSTVYAARDFARTVRAVDSCSRTVGWLDLC